MVLTGAAGCTGDAPSTPADGPTSAGVPASSAPPRQVFDPPTRFDTAGTSVGTGAAGDVLLYRSTVFVAGDAGTTVTDALTGQQRGVLTPSHPPITRASALSPAIGRTPVLVQHSGQPAVVVPYAVTVPASGTTAARQAVELLVADAATGAAITTVTVDAAPAEGDFAGVSGPYAAIVGARGNTVVLTIGKDVTVAVDLATATTLWRKNGYRAATVLGDVVLGLSSPDASYRQSVTGLSITDGAKRWSAVDVMEADLDAGGPAFAVLLGTDPAGKRFYALIGADGRLRNRTDGSYASGLRCWYDASAVTVCAVASSDPLFAVDATTGKDLWQLPATGRLAPTITAVWHGAVYGTAGGKPVILDAHTGTDKEASSGLAPVAVSGYAGVATQDGGRELLVHAATG